MCLVGILQVGTNQTSLSWLGYWYIYIFKRLVHPSPTPTVLTYCSSDGDGVQYCQLSSYLSFGCGGSERISACSVAAGRCYYYIYIIMSHCKERVVEVRPLW